MAQAVKRKGASATPAKFSPKKPKLSGGSFSKSKPTHKPKQEVEVDDDQSSFDGFTSEEEDDDELSAPTSKIVLDEKKSNGHSNGAARVPLDDGECTATHSASCLLLSNSQSANLASLTRSRRPWPPVEKPPSQMLTK